jgi:alkyl hydroperoxide reductase subunit AhpC
VVKAYEKFHPKGFEILGVSLDKPDARDAWLKAIEKDQHTWPQVSDLKYWDIEAAQLYYVRGIPMNFLLAPDGKIIAKNLRGNKLEELLN